MNSSNTNPPLVSNPSGLVAVESTYDFNTTWVKLTGVVEDNPNLRVIGTVDHADSASSVGMDLPPTKLLAFGNPALGSPIMASSRTAALDLPQKMAVWEAGGKVWLAYNAVSYLAARHNVGDNPSLPKVNGALAEIATQATGSDLGAETLDVSALTETNGLIVQDSSDDFEIAWAKLLTALEASPAEVAFTVDHGANSGGTLAATRLAFFGNPKMGTKLMQQSPSIAIDLPLKILVWEDEQGVHLAANDASFLATRHGIDPTELEPVQAATEKLLSTS